MEVISMNKDYIPAVTNLLSTGKPYVLPHHDYVYWMMGEYFPSSNFVALEDDKVIGFVCALPSLDKKCHFIWQIVVDAEYRGKKVASLLVNKIIEEAKQKGFTKLELSICSDNSASHKLFEGIAKELNSNLHKIGEYDSNEIVYSIELGS